jgi:glycosyltransferase involved in cell wall biosynthesis
VTTLSRATGWYGKHSGYYEQLPNFLQLICDHEVISPGNAWWHRFAGKMIALARGLPSRNQSLTWAEHRFTGRWLSKPGSLGFIASIETHLPMLRQYKKAPRNLIGAIHFPPSRWGPEELKDLARLSSAVVLYERDLDFFEKWVGKGRVRFVPHGIDHQFFHPARVPPPLEEPKKVLIVGQFDRDFESIREILSKIQAIDATVEWHLVAPAQIHTIPSAAALIASGSVTLHSGISDVALRELYQSSSLLLLPMLASGANNAIVEALACGLPIVTNDVGGIRSYQGGILYPVAQTLDELVQLTLHYLNHPGEKQKLAQRTRSYVEGELGWERVATLHLKAFQELSQI